MPSSTLAIARGQSARFKVKISQDGIVLSPPGTIANGSDAPTIAALTRLADEGGRAVFKIAGVNAGTATCTVGSGPGTLSIATTVSPPPPGPVLYEIDGDFEVT